jgi:hypothetical protein
MKKISTAAAKQSRNFQDQKMKSSGSGVCMTGGGGNRRPRKCPWRWWRKCWGCIGRSISI